MNALLVRSIVGSIVVWAAAAALPAAGALRSTSTATASVGAAQVDAPAIRRELRRSGVPVLLPRTVPRSIGAIRSVAVIVADRAGYYVGYSPVAGCGGALSCAFLHFAGSRAAAPGGPTERGSRRITLSDGRRAFFRPPDCSGATCTEASLTFERDGARYEIDVKVAGDSRPTLERLYASLRRVR